MKALKKIDKLVRIVNEDIPKKRDGYSIIKVLCSGVCRTDVFVANGMIKIDEDLILGHEFCGRILQSDTFQKDAFVTANPLINGSFLGLNFNGSFSEYIQVPDDAIYILPEAMDIKLGAYIEPISASLAPLKALKDYTRDKKVAIFGTNRIAKLTQMILLTKGITSELIDVHNVKKYDYIIETIQTEESFEVMINSLNKNGVIIIKSRNPKKISINFNDILKKEISLISTYYVDFNEAIKFAEDNSHLFEDFFGAFYTLEEWENVFEQDKQGIKKYFFLIGK